MRNTGQGAMVAKHFDKRVNTSEKKSNTVSAKKSLIKCHRCGKPGHKAAECYSRIGPNRNYQKNSENGKMADADDFCVLAYTHTVQQAGLQALETTRSKGWCLDSGCTSHLCNETNKFSNFTEVLSEKLNLASNMSTPITGKGAIHLNAEVNGQNRNLNLENVLYVPDLRTNLLSVSKITNKGYKVIFDEKSVKVIDNDGKIQLVAPRVNGLYYIRESEQDCNSATTIASEKVPPMSQTEIWHRRMGHLNLKDLSSSNRNGTVHGMEIKSSECDFNCDVCILGKMVKSPFPKKSERQKTLLELVHSDVCGPMRIESLGKSRFFVTFIDDYSRWCVVYMLKSKSEVFSAFKEFKAHAENQTGRKIKCLQSDNGTEYTSRDFENYLKESGIERRLSVTHTPQQNGNVR